MTSAAGVDFHIKVDVTFTYIQKEMRMYNSVLQLRLHVNPVGNKMLRNQFFKVVLYLLDGNELIDINNR